MIWKHWLTAVIDTLTGAALVGLGYFIAVKRLRAKGKL